MFVPAPRSVVIVMKRISPAFTARPVIIAARMRFASPFSPLTTCGVDMTADSEKDTIPNIASALLKPRQPEGSGQVSRMIVATNSTPTTATIAPTENFSHMPTSFIPTNTTPAPST